jgi:hypothetical protein
MAAPGSVRLWRPGRDLLRRSIAQLTFDAGPMLTPVEFSAVNYVLTALPKVVSRITRSGTLAVPYALRDRIQHQCQEQNPCESFLWIPPVSVPRRAFFNQSFVAFVVAIMLTSRQICAESLDTTDVSCHSVEPAKINVHLVCRRLPPHSEHGRRWLLW